MGNKLHGVEFSSIDKVFGIDTSSLSTIYGLNFCQEQGIHEGFEGTGFELTGWSKDDAFGGSTIDEDEATSGVAGSPVGWEDQCLELTIGDIDYGNISRAISDYGLMYFRCEFIINARTNNFTDAFPLACAEDGMGLLAWKLNLVDSGSNYVLECYCDYGIDWNYDQVSGLTEGTPYLVEVYFDWTLNKVEWKLDGVLQDSGINSSDTEIVKLFMGSDLMTHGQTVTGDNWTVYIDNCGFSTCGWVN